MKIKEMINKVLDDDMVKNWRHDSYLVHFFQMFEKSTDGNYQIGFYNKNTDKVTPVEFTGEEIKIGAESEVFKKGGIVHGLNLDLVKLDIEEALEKVQELQKEKYPGQEPMKVILVLQHIEGKEVYNISYVTRSFKTLNIKIDANDGQIIHDGLTSIFEFKGGEKSK